jgi:glycosyltransferase involved in cell wall biosynthesis
MLIVHVTPTLFSNKSVLGGGERYVFNIIKAIETFSNISNLNIFQKIITSELKDNSSVNVGQQIAYLYNLNKSKEKMSSLPSRLQDELFGADCVIIHNILTPFGEYAAAIAYGLGIPIVGCDLGGGRSRLMINHQCINMCSGQIYISDYSKLLNGDSFIGKSRVVIGPIDTELFSPGREVKTNTYALAVGRVLPHKGLDTIINALPNTMKLVIVGKTYNQRYFNDLKKLAKHKDVDFIDKANDQNLVAFYRNASVFVQASQYVDMYANLYENPELMGFSTLEALSVGVPTIVSRVASLPELGASLESFREFGSVNELSHMLNDIQNTTWPKPYDRVSQNTYIKNKYGMQHVGQSIIQLIQEIGISIS